MSAGSGSSAASQAYKQAGASAQQVAQIQAAERSYQNSLRSGGSGTTGANPQTLRDYVSGLGKTINTDNGSVLMNGNAFKYGSVPGTVYDPKSGTHYVTNRNAVNSIYGIGNNTNPAQQTTVPEQPIQQPYEPEPYEQQDNSAYIQQLAEAQRRSRISALDKQRTSSLSALDNQKAGIAPVYYDKKNQAAAQSDIGAMNFANYMAARGIRGAAGAMPEIYRNAGLQGQLGAYDRQEAAELGAIERQRANIEAGYASDVAAAEADIEAQAMQTAIDQANSDRTYNLQKSAQDYDIQQGNTERANSVADTKKQEWISTIGQYNNDYAAEINKVQNDGDTSNDWQIPYLQMERQKKLAAIEKARVEAEQQEFENQLKLAKTSKSGSSGGSSGGNGTSNTNTTDFLNSIMAFRTQQYAEDYFSKNYATAQANGVNLDYIRKQMKARWGTNSATPDDY